MLGEFNCCKCMAFQPAKIVLAFRFKTKLYYRYEFTDRDDHRAPANRCHLAHQAQRHAGDDRFSDSSEHHVGPPAQRPVADAQRDDAEWRCSVSATEKVLALFARRPEQCQLELDRYRIQKLTKLSESKCYDIIRQLVKDGKLKQRMHTGRRHVGWQRFIPFREARYTVVSK